MYTPSLVGLVAWVACLSLACTKRHDETTVVAEASAAPAASVASSVALGRGRCEDFALGFPSDALIAAAAPCAHASDCTVTHTLGSCYPLTTKSLAAMSPAYERWASLGCGAPSGSPQTLAVVAAPIAIRCGPEWSGVECRAEHCALVAADCAYGGMVRSECVKRGGRWGGCTQGRGRSPGCGLPTKDRGKRCTDSSECEGGCLPDDATPGVGKCSELTGRKGEVLVHGRTMIVE